MRLAMALVLLAALNVLAPTNSSYAQIPERKRIVIAASTVLDGKGQKLIRSVQVQLGADVLSVRLHRRRTQKKFRRDFFGRLAERDQAQHAPLRGRQRIKPVHRLAQGLGLLPSPEQISGESGT